MAKIVNKTGDNFRIKFVPKGYKDLYPKNPYRHTTVQGKLLADKTVAELTAIEIIDNNERKLGRTDLPTVAEEMTIGKLFRYFTNEIMPYQSYAAGTIKGYTNLMYLLINDLGEEFLFKNIDYALILKMYNTGERNAGLSKCRIINSIGSLGRQAIEDNKLTGTISGKPIKFPRCIQSPKNPLSLEQLSEIYQNPEIEKVTKNLIRLYVMTGCRRSELARPYFKWDQIDETAGVAYIKNKGHKKKHDNMFEIPWLDKHMSIIKSIHSHYLELEHPLADIYPIPITSQNVYERITVASKKSGIKFTPHDLRDTGATLILRSTGNIYAAKEFCGHASVRDTELAYADYNINDKTNATNQLLNHLGSVA